MSASHPPHVGPMKAGHPAPAEWIYRGLLRAYPPAFRAAFGSEMTQIFRDQCRTGEARTAGFWIGVVWDVAQSAPSLRVDAWRTRGHATSPTIGGVMKFIAILTVLLGMFEAAGAGTEGVAAMRQGQGGAYLLSVALSVIAGGLLLAAGVVTLRRLPSERRSASLAALGSLVAFLLARAVLGWMSVFLQLVGLLLPLVMLAALHWPRRFSGQTTA